MTHNQEMAVTIGLAGLLLVLGLTSLPGLVFALAWLIVGSWFVAKTQSRGLKADASFVVTWPIYLIAGK